MAPGEADDNVPNKLFFRLFLTGNILQKQVQQVMGLSTVQWAVLGALSREGYEQGTPFNQLTEYLVVSRQNLDGVLKRMERDGHVRRIPHPDDGRARLVLITESGQGFWNSLQPRIEAFYQQTLKNFSFDDGVSLLYLINKIRSGLTQANSSGQAEN